MLGWEIHIINNNTKVEYGDWLGGLGATKWIDRLVDAGKAEKIYQVASSYYLIKAKDLIPEIAVIESNAKDGVTKDGWISDFFMDSNALNECALDDVIVVQTYDAS
jgi:hypothetical protein